MRLNDDKKHFLANIYFEESLLAEKIKAKVIIDRLKTGDSVCYLYPSSEEYEKISKKFSFKIEGCFEDIAGKEIGNISIPKGYNTNAKKKQLAPSWEENVVTIQPDEISIRNRIETLEKNGCILFNITNNKEVLPSGCITSDFRGNIKADLRPGIILNSSKGLTITFDEYFRSKNTEVEDIDGVFSYAYQVLRIEAANFNFTNDEDLSGIKNIVDSVLWYLSFATRQRTVWTGLSTIINGEVIEYIRCNTWYPRHDLGDEPLIDKTLIKDFLQHCLDYIEKPDDARLDIYLPIVYLVGSKKEGKTSESRFLSLFMSLEALLDLHARKSELSRHLDKNSWKQFSDTIKACINGFNFSTDAIEDDKHKDLMKKKLSRLNEPALVSFYEDFCKSYSIDNSDLWPVFGRDSESALSIIRNKLVHGRRCKYSNYLDIASDHLQWVVERCLLSVLGWEKTSKVKKESLNEYCAYQNWKSYLVIEKMPLT